MQKLLLAVLSISSVIYAAESADSSLRSRFDARKSGETVSQFYDRNIKQLQQKSFDKLTAGFALKQTNLPISNETVILSETEDAQLIDNLQKQIQQFKKNNNLEVDVLVELKSDVNYASVHGKTKLENSALRIIDDAKRVYLLDSDQTPLIHLFAHEGRLKKEPHYSHQILAVLAHEVSHFKAGLKDFSFACEPQMPSVVASLKNGGVQGAASLAQQIEAENGMIQFRHLNEFAGDIASAIAAPYYYPQLMKKSLLEDFATPYHTQSCKSCKKGFAAQKSVQFIPHCHEYFNAIEPHRYPSTADRVALLETFMKEHERDKNKMVSLNPTYIGVYAGLRKKLDVKSLFNC